MTARRKGGKKEKKKEFLPLTLYFAFNYILLISKNKKQTQKKLANEKFKRASQTSSLNPKRLTKEDPSKG